MELFKIASVGGILATIGALGIGVIFHESIMDFERQISYKLLAMFIVTIAIEIILWVLFGIADWVILLISGLIIIWITAMTIMDGAYIYNDRDAAQESWMYWALAILLDIWIMLIRLFIIIVILSDDD